jgi:hypothetical protein
MRFSRRSRRIPAIIIMPAFLRMLKRLNNPCKYSPHPCDMVKHVQYIVTV